MTPNQFAAESVFAKGQKGFGGCFKQDREHYLFVVEHNRVERVRKGKDDMEVVGGSNVQHTFNDGICDLLNRNRFTCQ